MGGRQGVAKPLEGCLVVLGAYQGGTRLFCMVSRLLHGKTARLVWVAITVFREVRAQILQDNTDTQL